MSSQYDAWVTQHSGVEIVVARSLDGSASGNACQASLVATPEPTNSEREEPFPESLFHIHAHIRTVIMQQ